MRFRNVEVFEHLDIALTAIERHLLKVMAKRTPLNSPLVQGGTFENKGKWRNSMGQCSTSTRLLKHPLEFGHLKSRRAWLLWQSRRCGALTHRVLHFKRPPLNKGGLQRGSLRINSNTCLSIAVNTTTRCSKTSTFLNRKQWMPKDSMAACLFHLSHLSFDPKTSSA